MVLSQTRYLVYRIYIGSQVGSYHVRYHIVDQPLWVTLSKPLVVGSVGLAWLAVACRESSGDVIGIGTMHPLTYLRYFAARGEADRAQDRPHFFYGDYQRHRKLPPEALGRAPDEAWAASLDPLEGEAEGDSLGGEGGGLDACIDRGSTFRQFCFLNDGAP